MAPWMIPPDHAGGQYSNGESSLSGENVSPRSSRGINSIAAVALVSNSKGGMNLRPSANSQQVMFFLIIGKILITILSYRVISTTTITETHTSNTVATQTRKISHS